MIKHKLEAFIELFKHYKSVFKAHWENRHNVSQKIFNETEAEFLPSALSIQERPVSKASRLLAKLVILFLSLLLLWSIFGRIDISVNATGKIIPSARVKTIGSVDVASVKAIYVTEGQFVKAGQLLVELDSSSFDNDSTKFTNDESLAKLKAARSREVIKYVDAMSEPKLPAIEGIDADRIASENMHLKSEYREFSDKVKRMNAEIDRYSKGLAVATQKAKDFKELATAGDVSQHQYLEKEEARLDMAGRLQDAKSQKAMITSEAKRVAFDALKEATRMENESHHEAKKASSHSKLLKLTAPVDGTVQQLNVLTVGGVVPAAQPLMQIVPAVSAIEVEVQIESKDIGFVHEGQRAAIKIDAFEYTKYGLIPGKVTQVSRDAIQDEKKGLLYNAIVRLEKSSISINGKNIPLTAGMGAQVEIKTGTRRVIEYVLSPLLQHKRESLNER